MPSIRIGFSTDFNLVNEQVGIGTTLPTARLDVRGQIRADNSTGSGGISTLTTYDGFLHSQQAIRNNISIAETTKGNLNSISGEIVIGAEVTVSSGTPLTGGRLDSLTVTGTFDLPRGGSANREVTPEKGSTRFNQDLGQLEFYTGYEWRTVGSYDGSGRGRGVIGGGYDGSSNLSTIDFINITTTGNATSFGVLTASRRGVGNASSSVRGLFAAGLAPTSSNIIDYITIASEGNAIDFGDITRLTQQIGGCSSSTRGLFGGGYTPSPTSADTNIIDYVQISTVGNALDFGDLTVRRRRVGSLSSSTRGVWAGGIQDPTATSISGNVIDCITISSTGNAINFGNLTESRYSTSGLSNSTRGIFGGSGIPGSPADSSRNTIDYITISSTGNATDFGDLTAGRLAPTSTANSIRGVFSGGYLIAPNTRVNIVDFITIMTTGNAQDFGDLTVGREQSGMVSDSHGGLGGF